MSSFTDNTATVTSTHRGRQNDDAVTGSWDVFDTINSFRTTRDGQERSVKIDEIGRVIRNGAFLKTEASKSVVACDGIVVIIETGKRRVESMKSQSESEILMQISVDIPSNSSSSGVNAKCWRTPAPVESKILVTAWRDKHVTLNTELEYRTLDQLTSHIEWVGDLTEDREAKESAFVNALTAAASVHNPVILAKILNFQGVAPREGGRGRPCGLTRIPFCFLHYCVWQGFPVAVEQLMRHGADVNIKALSSKACTPIFYALSTAVPPAVKADPTIRENIVRQFLNSSIDVNLVCDYKTTGRGADKGVCVLQKAVYGNYEKISQMLLDAGADPDIETKYGTPRDLAAKNNLNLVYK